MTNEEKLLEKELFEKIVKKIDEGKTPWELKGKTLYPDSFGTYNYPYIAHCNGVDLSLNRSGGRSNRSYFLEIRNGKAKMEFTSNNRLYSKTLKILFETVDNLVRKPWEKEEKERKKAKKISLINQLTKALG